MPKDWWGVRYNACDTESIDGIAKEAPDLPVAGVRAQTKRTISGIRVGVCCSIRPGIRGWVWVISPLPPAARVSGGSSR
jgi:hypothetical protein